MSVYVCVYVCMYICVRVYMCVCVIICIHYGINECMYIPLQRAYQTDYQQ